MKTTVNGMLALLCAGMLLILCAGSGIAEREPWNCPECGRTGNTGNFCGTCGYPASWDCPNCGRTGNTGNYCGSCAYPNPWSRKTAPTPVPTPVPQLIHLGQLVPFGAYANTDLYWYAVDINRTANTVTLVSQYAVDVVRYHSSTSRTVWAYSDLRNWLNNVFLYRAFSADQANALAETAVSNSVDKVFILSQEELYRYLPYIGNTTLLTGLRVCYTAGTQTGHPIYVNELGNSSWWLRTGSTAEHATFVGAGGKIYSSGNPPTSSDNGVRPVIVVDLDWFYTERYSAAPPINRATEAPVYHFDSRIGCAVRIISSSARLRYQPDLNAEQIGSVLRGQQYSILDVQTGSDGKAWYQISVWGQEGWIAAGVCEIIR